MSGAASVFGSFDWSGWYGFFHALLRGWFLPVVFALIVIAFLILGTLLRRLYEKMAERD